jgi:chromosomal replication initiation ATPase DnaA
MSEEEYAKLLAKSAVTEQTAYNRKHSINSIVKSAVEPTPTSEQIDQIVEKVCDMYRVTREQMEGREKSERLFEARRVIAYVLRSVFKMNGTEVGSIIMRNRSEANKIATQGKIVVNSSEQLVSELTAIIRKSKKEN